VKQELPQDSVVQRLEYYGQVTRSAVRRWIPSKEPRKYLYDAVASYPMRGGRMLRPSLCLATARVFGASVEAALPAAVSIELLHNALLIHDDIEDESAERRGKPTLHQEIGEPLAINAGDFLAFLSFRPIVAARKQLGSTVALRVLEEIDQMAEQSAEGQALDLGWRRDNELSVTESDYLKMVLKKTCWLTTLLPLRLGALIGSKDTVELARFMKFGFFLGAAFQIQDDLLNLEGDHVRYGKELAGDLFEGKRTLMLIRLLEQSSEEDRQLIRSSLDQPRKNRDPEMVAWMLDQMRATGCMEYARQFAHGLSGAAEVEFEHLFGRFPDSPDLEFLSRLPVWVIERS
jgi:geranylgeranyl diphosphate synthase type II